MKGKRREKHIRNTVMYTIAATVLLSVVFFGIISYMYKETEESAFDDLHMQTLTIKENINLQIKSDIENLSTMASMASKLYADGEDFQLVFDSFKEIGLIENVGILMPDNTMETKMGTLDVNGQISFAEEVKRGQYTSGKTTDITNPKRKIVRSCVPVEVGGETVALLYGSFELSNFEGKYQPMAEAQNAHLYIIERYDGDFILDTWHEKATNIELLSEREYKEGFSYKKMKMDISQGMSGYTAFMAKDAGQFFYAHYAPLEIDDWEIMLSAPESYVFARVDKMRRELLLVFLTVVLIMVIYLVSVFATERKQSNLNLYASKIRKLLLGVNQQFSSVRQALEEITIFSKSRSAFFVNTDKEDYNYIIPVLENKLLINEDREYFISSLFNYAQMFFKGKNSMVLVFNLRTNRKLERVSKDLYEFFKANDISRVCFAVITENFKRHMSILGVVNPKRFSTPELLKDIAVCFSMAVYNKKYLTQTEYTALTDSLTGISNRVAYKKDIVRFAKQMPELFTCIYIDVNELHIINNKYGHSAGDNMLIFIAQALVEFFKDSYIYRMGGDEFLVFTKDIKEKEIISLINKLNAKVEENDYHISIGWEVKDETKSIEDIVKEAEKKMYEAKAKYYQNKEQKSMSKVGKRRIDYMLTNIPEIDATLSILSLHYFAIYCVSLDTDKNIRVLTPEYFRKASSPDEPFKKIFSRYIHDLVKPDFHRSLEGFMDYEILKKQISNGSSPSIKYERIDGEAVRLTIYSLPKELPSQSDTIWVFEKEEE